MANQVNPADKLDKDMQDEEKRKKKRRLLVLLLGFGIPAVITTAIIAGVLATSLPNNKKTGTVDLGEGVFNWSTKRPNNLIWTSRKTDGMIATENPSLLRTTSWSRAPTSPLTMTRSSGVMSTSHAGSPRMESTSQAVFTTFAATSTFGGTTDHACSSAEFDCLDESCVQMDLRCDGTNDCANGADERACESFPAKVQSRPGFT
ncbi:uncharacterized protein [Ptychodera flava]|uniref:uncharacterized protein n=1 Tax=Ptychodera flava TaxID=63121 RepID=UPI00396A06C0